MRKLGLSVLILVLTAVAFRTLRPPLLNGISFSQVVVDKNNHLLRQTLSRDEKYRIQTPLKEMSGALVEAVLLHEDQYFRYHLGFNPWAIFRSFTTTYVGHGRRIGGSTISMQVARLKYHIVSRHFVGKIYQILRALQLELFYGKNEILEAYLNLAPYGGNIEGVPAASLIYFNKL